jgi:hypothetical protein
MSNTGISKTWLLNLTGCGESLRLNRHDSRVKMHKRGRKAAMVGGICADCCKGRSEDELIDIASKRWNYTVPLAPAGHA